MLVAVLGKNKHLSFAGQQELKYKLYSGEQGTQQLLSRKHSLHEIYILVPLEMNGNAIANM